MQACLGTAFLRRGATIILVSDQPFHRRAIQTRSSTRRCVPPVRPAAEKQQPSSQNRPLLSDHSRHPLSQAARAPSPDNYPPPPCPLLCHLTFQRVDGQCVVSQSVPGTTSLREQSVFRPERCAAFASGHSCFGLIIAAAFHSHVPRSCSRHSRSSKNR